MMTNKKWLSPPLFFGIEIQRFLIPLLRPRYHVAIEERSYLTVLPPGESINIPDVLLISSWDDVGDDITNDNTIPVVFEVPSFVSKL